MFEDFYQLNQNPFQINTDPRFLWLGEKHKEALAILQYGVLGCKSFLLLTGDVGTGKTTLINALLKGQGNDTLIATIQDPDLSTLDLYNYISQSFGILNKFDTKGKFLLVFKKFLSKNYYNGKKVLLIVDEAQKANQEVLEAIRCLSNIEVDGNKLINIFFIGQNEFNDVLLKDENKAIRQRITISYNIKPLTFGEVGKYIQFRLFKAGAKSNIFKKDAVREIFNYTKGYPRLINILCDRCLLTGFVGGEKTIGKKTVRECCAEIDISMVSSKKQEKIEYQTGHKDKVPPPKASSYRKRFIEVAFLALLLGGGVYFYDTFKSSFIKSYPGVLSYEETMISVPSASGSQNDKHLEQQDIEDNGVSKREGDSHVAIMKKVRPPAEEGFYLPTSVGVEGGRTSPSEDDTVVPRDSDLASSIPGHDRKMQIFFRPDSISPSPEYIEALKIFSDRFMKLDRGRLVVRGYTDKTGPARYNKKLAKFRADVVKTFLEGRGVDGSKIITIGVMSEAALASGTSSAPPRDAARKVELEIVLSGFSE